MPQGVTWRIINSTFRCTGNETHPLPAAAAGSSDDSSKARFATAMVAAMAALLAGAYWLVNRNGAFWVAGRLHLAGERATVAGCSERFWRDGDGCCGVPANLSFTIQH